MILLLGEGGSDAENKKQEINTGTPRGQTSTTVAVNDKKFRSETPNHPVHSTIAQDLRAPDLGFTEFWTGNRDTCPSAGCNNFFRVSREDDTTTGEVITDKTMLTSARFYSRI